MPEEENYYSEDEPAPEKQEMSKEEQKDIEMESGERDEDIEKQGEDGEIEPWEEGFMKGESDGGKDAKCRECGEILIGRDFIEKELDNEIMRFCSDKCLEEYEEEHEETE